MKKGVLAGLLAGSVLLGGCSALLERSYSMVEPYADRYWDSGAEDTLRVDSYQDLVNSLLMLIEQRAEEAVIRCYDEVSSRQKIAEARSEVRRDTMQGSYLLQGIQFDFEEGANYSSATFHMTYREGAEDLGSVMTLSDSQSLVDLLRLAVREDHEKITAWFTYSTPREAVTAAVESFWQELCREEMEAASGQAGDIPDGPPPEDGEGAEDGGQTPGDGSEPEGGPESPPEDGPEPSPEDVPEGEPETEAVEPVPEAPSSVEGEPEGESPDAPEGEGDALEPEPIVYPPCPWTVRFYPNQETAELVEILLKRPRETP